MCVCMWCVCVLYVLKTGVAIDKSESHKILTVKMLLIP